MRQRRLRLRVGELGMERRHPSMEGVQQLQLLGRLGGHQLGRVLQKYYGQVPNASAMDAEISSMWISKGSWAWTLCG